MRKHNQITVIGPIASGKTTASRLISKKLKLPLVDADLFEENPFLPNYIKNNARWSFATELFFTIKRIKKLKNLSKLLKKSSVVVDSGLIMSHNIYTKNHLIQGTMSAAEWDFFCEIISDYQNLVPAPNLIVSLKTSPKMQMKRISKRGRSFESGYTLDYLKQITDRIYEYEQQSSNIENVTLLSFDSEKMEILNNEKNEKKFLEMVKKALKT